MATIGDLVVNLSANTQRLSKGLKGAGRQVSAFASRAAIGIAAVGSALGALAVGKGISLATEQIAAEKKLEAVIKATGGAAGFSAEQIKAYASELQAVTNFGDEATISAAAVLATFKNIKGTEFKEALATAQDMSAVFGQDLQSSIVQVGKALDDPIRGASALRRIGVSLSEQESQRIKQLQEQGDMVGAQRILLEALEAQVGGAAEAMADPLTQAKNTLGDVGEAVGMVAIELLTATLEATNFQATMQGFANFMTGTFIPVFKAVLENWGSMWDMMVAGAALKLVTIMEDVKHFGMQVASVAKFIWESFVDAFETVGDAAGTVFANIKAGNFDDPLEGFQNRLGETALELPDRVTSELEDELQKQFNAAAFDFQEGFADSLAASEAAAGDGAAGAAGAGVTGGTAQATQQTAQFAEAATQGSQSAFSSILKNVFGKQDKAVDKTAKNTEETVAVLDDILDAVGNQGNSVTVVSSLI